MNTRQTASKTAIFDLLQDTEGALSHKEIMGKLDGICDRVTVYRVLDRLIDEGHIHQVLDMEGVKRFATCTDCNEHHHHNHVHFNCTQCETVNCLDDVQPSINMPEGYVIKESVFTLSGLCPTCSNKTPTL